MTGTFLNDIITTFTTSVTGFASALGTALVNGFTKVALTDTNALSAVGIVIVVAIALGTAIGLFYSAVKLLKLRR